MSHLNYWEAYKCTLAHRAFHVNHVIGLTNLTLDRFSTGPTCGHLFPMTISQNATENLELAVRRTCRWCIPLWTPLRRSAVWHHTMDLSLKACTGWKANQCSNDRVHFVLRWSCYTKSSTCILLFFLLVAGVSLYFEGYYTIFHIKNYRALLSP